MKTKVFLFICLVALLSIAANSIDEISGRSVRYRGGSIIKIDSTASIQDDDGAWTLGNSALSALATFAGGTGSNVVVAGTNVTVAVTNGAYTVSGTVGLLEVTNVVSAYGANFTNGLTTNITVLTALNQTNTFYFTNGLLRAIN